MKFVLHSTVALLAMTSALAIAQSSAGTWPTYGGDPGGQRYSSANQIDKTNVSRLQQAWTFHTGASGHGGSFEATPILFNNSLYFTSPYDQVFALDPATGQKRWSYDPQLAWGRQTMGIITSRGVASWTSADAAAGPCSKRIFVATLDSRLIALDAGNGQPCSGFGSQGAIDLRNNVEYRTGDEYAETSPPSVIGDVVVVGSAITDNLRVDVEFGDVRGFDARTGKLLWTWEPMPWAKHQKVRTGAGNTWAVITADVENNLVFLPTSSPSPDYYGGLRPGDDRDADSIVAIDARTGAKRWAFQVVHHDIWDYDIAAQPLLFTFHNNIPAVAIATKMGLVFVLNRLSGAPLWPVTERPVPQSDVPGEVTSSTQPFSDLPPLSPITLDRSSPMGLNAQDDAACRHLLSGLRYQGIYSPPSLQGTVLFPSNVGGVNWGSAALDPATGILYANTNRLPYVVKLERRPRLSPEAVRRFVLSALIACAVVFVLLLLLFRRRRKVILALACIAAFFGMAYVSRFHIYAHLRQNPWLNTGGAFADHFGKEFGLNSGAPYILLRQPLTSSYDDVPCGPQPWGTVSALNLNTAQSSWQTPLGTKAVGQHTGTVNVGGPIVTAGGLVFTAASQEAYLRAFDAATGIELWKGQMPVPAQATPMTYMFHGKQYVVVADGGHYAFGTNASDGVIAFALP